MKSSKTKKQANSGTGKPRNQKMEVTNEKASSVQLAVGNARDQSSPVVTSSFLREFRKFFNSSRGLGNNVVSKIKKRRVGILLEIFCSTNNVFYLTLSPFKVVSRLKSEIIRKLCLNESENIVQIFFKNMELKDSKSLNQCGLRNRSKIFIWTKRRNSVKNSGKPTIRPFGCVPVNKKTNRLIKQVIKGLRNGYTPELSMDGSGGAYFMKDGSGKSCAIFKPFDEEPYAPNNPRIYRGELGTTGIKPGFFSGNGASREVAAYMLDTGGFSGVPMTTLVAMDNCFGFHSPTPKLDSSELPKKIGSLQKIAHNEDCAGNYGWKRYDLEEVHKIGILDLHTVNLDRNDENILVNFRKDSKMLDFVPIDHGYCLPSCLVVDWYDWIWLSWPQSKKPFSDKSKEYVEAINIRKDVDVLRSLGIEEEAILVFKIVNILLKKSVKADLTLYQIAKILLRDKKDKHSRLENIVVHGIFLTYILKKNFDVIHFPKKLSLVEDSEGGYMEPFHSQCSQCSQGSQDHFQWPFPSEDEDLIKGLKDIIKERSSKKSPSKGNEKCSSAEEKGEEKGEDKGERKTDVKGDLNCQNFDQNVTKTQKTSQNSQTESKEPKVDQLDKNRRLGGRKSIQIPKRQKEPRRKPLKAALRRSISQIHLPKCEGELSENCFHEAIKALTKKSLLRGHAHLEVSGNPHQCWWPLFGDIMTDKRYLDNIALLLDYVIVRTALKNGKLAGKAV